MARYIALGLLGLLHTACLPEVYLIDRQSVLELEASGEWQELDAVYRKKALQKGPVPLETMSGSLEQKESLRATHADQEATTPR